MITENIGRVFPQHWERFINAIPEQLQHSYHLHNGLNRDFCVD